MKQKNFCPTIIDIEASGLNRESYPIEVGLALTNGKHYCRLIKPDKDWTYWDSKAEKVHGITRECLCKHGASSTEIALELNRLLENQTVYTDGWVVDQPWLIKLFFAAGIRQKFHISDLQMILTEAQMEIWHPYKEKVMLDLGLQRHRASYDAQIIQETYRRTLLVTG